MNRYAVVIIGLLALIAFNQINSKPPVVVYEPPPVEYVEPAPALTVEDICLGSGGHMGGYRGQTCVGLDQDTGD